MYLSGFKMIMTQRISRSKSICYNTRAYTLVEILVTMTIVSVLLAFVAPAIRKARDKGVQVKCISNMRQIGLAFRMYQNDHKGKYPQVFVSPAKTWQSFLADPSVGGIYMSGIPLVGDGWGEMKFDTKFLCPTMVKRSDFHAEPVYWGYCINNSRVDISYNAGGDPWFDISYQGADLDEIYKEPARQAVLCDGNQRHMGGGDWNAFTPSGNWYDWTIIPIHDSVNVLFLDGHVENMSTATSEQSKFNQVWYGGIPATGNTWL